MRANLPANEYLTQEAWDKTLSYCNQIRKASQETGIDHKIVAALILWESGGNSDSFSSDGAIGLMQVMPRDGIAANFYCGDSPCFSNRPTTKELLDPTFNIEYGASLLRENIDSWGSLQEGLHHYGPANTPYEDYVYKILDIAKSVEI